MRCSNLSCNCWFNPGKHTHDEAIFSGMAQQQANETVIQIRTIKAEVAQLKENLRVAVKALKKCGVIIHGEWCIPGKGFMHGCDGPCMHARKALEKINASTAPHKTEPQLG